ncbi:MAG: hypothetical protein HY650_10265 [Acidobacteria bacterium]|nr:hypothetical protein [Acidobacteriota bacterium]
MGRIAALGLLSGLLMYAVVAPAHDGRVPQEKGPFTVRKLSDGDAIVYFPQEKVVHMSDLLFHKVVPFIDRAHGASTSEWIETIDAVLARVDPSAQFIPGHGEVCSASDLKAFKQYFFDPKAAVQKAVSAGKSKAEAITETTLGPVRAVRGLRAAVRDQRPYCLR